MDRNLADVMREGQEKTLEAMALLRKELAGTLTADEKTRLAMLNGNLLALADQATNLGFNPVVGAGLEVNEDEVLDETDLEYDDSEEVDEVEDYDEGNGYDEDICYCGDPSCTYRSY